MLYGNQIKEDLKMGKKILKKIIAITMAGAICFGGTTTLASTQNLSQNIVENTSIVSPCFIAIIRCLNNISLNYGGKLTCEGITEVQDGYIAGITIELQQYRNGVWNKIKTWSGYNYDYICLSRDWYVENGYSYRLKLTHTALNENYAVIDSFVSYSRTVVY